MRVYSYSVQEKELHINSFINHKFFNFATTDRAACSAGDSLKHASHLRFETKLSAKYKS